ncbi:unnamed protein product [Withania somnifera]
MAPKIILSNNEGNNKYEVVVNKVGTIKTPNHPINIFVQEGLQKMLIVNEKIGSVERRKWIPIHIHKNYIRRRRIFDFFLKRKRIVINVKKRHLLPNSEEFEPRFPDERGRVLVYLIHNLDVKNLDIGNCVVANYLAVNIFGFLPCEIRFEPKMEDFEGYQMIHSAIQLKQSIIDNKMVRNPLFFQPNRSFDFGKKLSLSIYCFFYTHISIIENDRESFKLRTKARCFFFPYNLIEAAALSIYSFDPTLFCSVPRILTRFYTHLGTMKYFQNFPLIRHAIFTIHSLSGSVVEHLNKFDSLSDHKNLLSEDLFLLFGIEHQLQRFDRRLFKKKDSSKKKIRNNNHIPANISILNRTLYRIQLNLLIITYNSIKILYENMIFSILL